MRAGRATVEQAAGGNEEHTDTHRRQYRTVPVQLAQRRTVTFEQLGLWSRLQARRNDQYTQARRGDRRAIRGRQQLPRLICLPEADTNVRQFDGPQLRHNPVGHQEQVSQAMHSGALHAGVQQQADVQAGEGVSFCLHSVVRANPQVSAHSL